MARAWAEGRSMTRTLECIRTVLLMAVAIPFASGPNPASAADDKIQLLFVQSAEGVKADADTLRLVDVGQQTIYFSDRPVRMAGHMKMSAFLEEWTAAAGPTNFSQDPPNATLSVYQPGQADSTLTVVEISKPVVDGKDLVYHYKLIEGKMPAKGGAAALFIDTLGVGGGVGLGYHGVGVGRRGPGVR
jgi:hypothetical protein